MKNLKKITAMAVVFAMVLSLMSFGVFAADTAIFRFETSAATIGTNGGEVTLDVYLDNGAGVGVSYEVCGFNIKLPFALEGTTITQYFTFENVSGLEGSLNSKTNNIVFLTSTAATTSPDVPVATIKIKTLDTAVAGTTYDFALSSLNASPNTLGTAPEKFSLAVVQADEILTVNPAVAPTDKPIGTSAEDVIAALPSKVTVATTKNSSSVVGSEVNVTWKAPADYDAMKLTAQTFTGTLDVTDPITVADTCEVKVDVTLVPLTTGEVAVTPETVQVKAKEDGAAFTAEEVKAAVEAAITEVAVANDKGDITDVYVEGYTVTGVELAGAVKSTVDATVTVNGASKEGLFNLTNVTDTVKVEVIPAEVPYAEDTNFAVAQKKIRKSGDITVTINNVKADGATEAVYEITLVREGDDTPYVETKTVDLTAKEVGAYSEIVKIAAEDAFADIAVDDVIAVSVKADGATMFCDEEKNTSVDVTIVKGSNRPAGGGIPSNGSVVKPNPDPNPVDPNPVDPNPVDPNPVDPNPVEPVEGEFADVAGHWAEEAINNLKDKGVVGGKGDGVFDPDGQVTRAEFAKMIAVMFDLKAVATESAFTDCTAADWFTPYVIAAAEAGYIKGVSETEFAPNALITRQDICTILGRVLNTTADGADFVDSADIADYAAEYVDTLVGLGVINGYEDGTFKPLANATRAEVAKILDAVSKLEVAEEEATEEEVVEEEATEEVVEEEATEEVVEEEATEEEVVEEETTEEEVVEEEATEEAAE